MPSMHRTNHLDCHHRRSLSQMFQHPVIHNVERQSIGSLLEVARDIEETRPGYFPFTLASEPEYFELPNHKYIDTPQGVGAGAHTQAFGLDNPMQIRLTTIPAGIAITMDA